MKDATELANVVDRYVIEGRMSDEALFIDTHPTDLRKIIDIVLSGLPPHVVDDRVRVTGSDVVCLADPLRLRQVLRSMVNNALAYTSANPSHRGLVRGVSGPSLYDPRDERGSGALCDRRRTR
ncbi:MAG TPA: hypothetical protein VM848_12165 [Acidimicrobiia bacterium]|nr:hypothetical protein [Acidimicrobiia bacterium]